MQLGCEVRFLCLTSLLDIARVRVVVHQPFARVFQIFFPRWMDAGEYEFDSTLSFLLTIARV
jgi:hypothetical protein